MKHFILAIASLLLLTCTVHAQQYDPISNKNKSAEDTRKEWRKILRWSDKCEELFDSDEGIHSGIKFWNLDSDKYLVEVECGLLAYQRLQIYYFYDRSSKLSRLLSFSSYYKKGSGQILSEEDPELGGYAGFDASSKELTVWTKFRGDSDCGALAIYSISPAGVVALKEFRAKFECDGKETLPENYPLVFPRPRL